MATVKFEALKFEKELIRKKNKAEQIRIFADDLA